MQTVNVSRAFHINVHCPVLTGVYQFLYVQDRFLKDFSKFILFQGFNIPLQEFDKCLHFIK